MQCYGLGGWQREEGCVFQEACDGAVVVSTGAVKEEEPVSVNLSRLMWQQQVEGWTCHEEEGAFTLVHLVLS